MARLERLSYCQNDPRFGWNYIRSFYQLGQLLPIDTHEDYLVRGFEYLDGNYDAAVEEAALMITPANRLKSYLMDIHLIDRTLSMEEIADRLGLSLDVVNVYEGLFFGVRDRLHEPLFLPNLLYPNSRRVEFRHDYMQREGIYHILLRLSYSQTLDVACQLAGFRVTAMKNTDAAVSAKQLEATIMSAANFAAQTGFLNDPRLPVVKHARSIITAAKASGQEQTSDDMTLGLGAVSMSMPIIDTIKQLRSNDVEARQARLQARMAAAPLAQVNP
jgi:hypothetical protein